MTVIHLKLHASQHAAVAPDQALGDRFAFHCSACGQCCNTPPLLTLAELLRFESRFIGALALRRVPRLIAGRQITLAGKQLTITADDETAQRTLFDTLLFAAPGGDSAGDALQIALQAVDYPSLQACPALDAQRLCSLHASGKPGACNVVPLDALQPDRLQHAVLASRSNDHDYLDAGCISAGTATTGHAPLTADGTVVDLHYHPALQQQRAALAADHAHWGKQVHAVLADALRDPAMWQRIPHDGFFNLSLVPVLAVLAASAPHRPARCLQYVDAQLQLIEHTLAAALARKHPADKPFTAQLRGYAQAYQALRPQLAHHAAAALRHSA
ncbi:hypothetical protein IGB42_00841 [Andreprevotia sp. IGB-42]|uniref:YkgJ family cysteine cluster protein n=1 Tax=Andreprevotia sp. IGB-42 TaxID=2497473 RepID=UPI00135BACF1|nr:YkgJ family cysteine cluster protein [Andreprevotia sp. IGB-42]KAF0814786.1 hypothetical protein IGB42_00841 [Andreprevotia sp. IGB-42]